MIFHSEGNLGFQHYITVNCPLGTYYSLEHLTCESCWTGSYQDEEGQLECKSCPSGSYTEYLHSRSISECKGRDFCLIGTAVCEFLVTSFWTHGGSTGMKLARETRSSPNYTLMHMEISKFSSLLYHAGCPGRGSEKSWPMMLCLISVFHFCISFL